MGQLVNIRLVNKTNIVNYSDIFISIIGTNSSGEACFGRIDTSTGIVMFIPVNAYTDTKLYSYKLSDIPRVIQMPSINSGRIYFSIKYPLSFGINVNDQSQNVIVEPNGFDMRNANYYFLYDKVEFSYNDTGFWINPTSVDFFSLPINIDLYSDDYYLSNNKSDNLTSAGYSLPRNVILDKIKNIFQDNLANKSDAVSAAWQKLFLYYKNTSAILRVMSPAKAMQQINDQITFPHDYLDSFISAVWDYYAQDGNSLQIDCSTLKDDPCFAPKLQDYIFTGKIIDNEFIFENKTKEQKVVISKPSTFSMFTGAQGSFDFPNHTIGAIIAQSLSAAFSIGCLPAISINDETPLLNKEYFAKLKANDDYYKDNAAFDETAGPWYDLYSKAIHNVSPQEPVYAFPYDDLLSQDGTLHTPVVTDNTQAVITLQDMSDTVVPNPYINNNKYKVTMTIGQTPDGKCYSLTYKDAQVTPLNPVVFDNVTTPICVVFNNIAFSIYIDPVMILPNNTLSNGIVINVTGDKELQMNFPAPPPSIGSKFFRSLKKIFSG